MEKKFPPVHFMNVFTLKIIAVVTMLIDHLGAILPEVFGFPGSLNFFRVIGRLAFPVFVYLLAEGFRHTGNRARFLARLGVFAILSEVPFDLALRTYVNFLSRTNIFYTLFLGGAAIVAYERVRKHNSLAAFLPVAVFAFAARALSADYGAVGVAFIFAMYAVTNKDLRLAVMAFFCVSLHINTVEFAVRHGLDAANPYLLSMIPATLISVALLAFYTGKRGPGAKWFFYVFYPAHLAVLAMLARVF